MPPLGAQAGGLFDRHPTPPPRLSYAQKACIYEFLKCIRSYMCPPVSPTPTLFAVLSMCVCVCVCQPLPRHALLLRTRTKQTKLEKKIAKCPTFNMAGFL